MSLTLVTTNMMSLCFVHGAMEAAYTFTGSCESVTHVTPRKAVVPMTRVTNPLPIVQLAETTDLIDGWMGGKDATYRWD